MFDKIRTAILTGDANANPVIHIGVTNKVERQIAQDNATYTQIEVMDRKIMGIPYDVIPGDDERVAVLHLSDLNRHV